jgi:hypothetical protein
MPVLSHGSRRLEKLNLDVSTTKLSTCRRLQAKQFPISEFYTTMDVVKEIYNNKDNCSEVNSIMKRNTFKNSKSRDVVRSHQVRKNFSGRGLLPSHSRCPQEGIRVKISKANGALKAAEGSFLCCRRAARPSPPPAFFHLEKTL